MSEICKVPFGFIEIFPNGDVFSCCPAYLKNGMNDHIGNIFKESFDEIINSEKAIRIRKNILNNDYSMCKLELCKPNTDAVSYLLNSKYCNCVKDIKLKKVNIIKFSYDNDCNVNCKSCRVRINRNSKETIEELDKKAKKYFLPIIKYTDKVCLIGSGDPLASKHTRNFIKMIIEEYPNIKFDLHTNGLLLNEKMLKELNILDKLSYVQISIPAATKDVYDSIVLNGNFDLLMENLNFISNLKKEKKIEGIFLFFVVSKINLNDAKEFMNIAKKYSAEVFYWRLRDWGVPYSKEQQPNDYEIYKVFTDKIFDDESCHLDPDIINIRNNKNIIENFFYDEIHKLSLSNIELSNKINELNDKYIAVNNNVSYLNISIDIIINTIAWWIPLKKWREAFRNKFRPDQTRPDQTRPDQTRPETICKEYIQFYNNSETKKLQPMLHLKNVA